MSPVSNMQPKDNGLQFVPTVVETFGAWGAASKPVLDFVARATANNKKMDEDLVKVHLRQAVSVLLKHRDPFSPAVDEGAPNVDEVLAWLDDKIAVG